MTPQQQQLFQLIQRLNAQRGAPGSNQPLTYQQWLAMRGTGNPYAQQPQGGGMSGLDLKPLFGGAAGGGGLAAWLSGGGIATPELVSATMIPGAAAAGGAGAAGAAAGAGAGAAGAGAGAAGAGSAAGAASGASGAGAAGLGSLASIAGPAAFMLTAPIWGKGVMKVGEKVGKALGMGTQSTRKFNADELTATKAKGISNRMPGFFENIAPERQKEILKDMYDMHTLALPGQEGVHKGNEYLHLGRLIQDGPNSRVSESGVRKMGDRTGTDFDFTEGKINWKHNVKPDVRKRLEAIFSEVKGAADQVKFNEMLSKAMGGMGEAPSAGKPGAAAPAPAFNDKMWVEGRDPGKPPSGASGASSVIPPGGIRDMMYIVGRDGPMPPGFSAPAGKAPMMIPKAPARSKTQSPGIGLDGKRIQY